MLVKTLNSIEIYRQINAQSRTLHCVLSLKSSELVYKGNYVEMNDGAEAPSFPNYGSFTHHFLDVGLGRAEILFNISAIEVGLLDGFCPTVKPTS